MLTHYSRSGTIYFYGGEFSNFVGGPIALPPAHFGADDEQRFWYYTVEHYFQAAKAIDRETHDKIAAPRDPWKSKMRGNNCALRPDWEEIKYAIMVQGVRAKFTQDDELRTFLLATDNRDIAEDSPTDTIWGIKKRLDGSGGLNLLGRALMQVRAELRGDDAQARGHQVHAEIALSAEVALQRPLHAT